jgi:hypothetical protein
VIVGALPAALLSGLSRAPLEFSPGLPFVPVAGVVLWLAWRDRLVLATLTTALAVVFGVAYVKGKVFPILDRQVSVRMFWRNNAASAANACVEDVRRDWVYGLNYYAGHPLLECRAGGGEGPPRITTRDQKLVLSPRGESP